MKTRANLKDFVIYCLWKEYSTSNLPQALSDWFLWQFWQLQGLSLIFNLKLEQLSHKKVLNFALVGNCFSDLFTEVKIWYYKKDC